MTVAITSSLETGGWWLVTEGRSHYYGAQQRTPKSEAQVDCLLFRHGIAVESDQWEGPDERRPLTEKGKKRVRQAAVGLLALNCKPTHLLSSPMIRAYDTARLLRAVACPTLKIETREELAGGSPPDKVVAFLRTLPADSMVWCVGHEPLLGEMAGLLLSGKAVVGLSFKKAGAALLRLPTRFGLGEGQLRWWLQPMQLRALGKGKSTEADSDGVG